MIFWSPIFWSDLGYFRHFRCFNLGLFFCISFLNISLTTIYIVLFRWFSHRFIKTEARSFVNSTIREVRSERKIKVGQRIPERGVDKKLEKREPHRLSLIIPHPISLFQSSFLIPPPKASEGPTFHSAGFIHIPIPNLPFVKMPFPQHMENIAIQSKNAKYSFSRPWVG